MLVTMLVLIINYIERKYYNFLNTKNQSSVLSNSTENSALGNIKIRHSIFDHHTHIYISIIHGGYNLDNYSVCPSVDKWKSYNWNIVLCLNGGRFDTYYHVRDLKDIMLSEISQTWKNIQYDSIYKNYLN